MKQLTDFPEQVEHIKSGFIHFLTKNGFLKHKKDESTLYAKRSRRLDQICTRIATQTGIQFKPGENRKKTVQFIMFNCALVDFSTFEIFQLEHILHLLVDDDSFYTHPSEKYFLAIESFYLLASQLSESGYILNKVKYDASHARTSIIERFTKRGNYLLMQIKKPGVRFSKETPVAFDNNDTGTLNEELHTSLRMTGILGNTASGREITKMFTQAQESNEEVAIISSLNEFFNFKCQDNKQNLTSWLLQDRKTAVLSKYLPKKSQSYFIKRVQKKFPNTPFSDFIRFDIVKSHTHKESLYRLTVTNMINLLSKPEPQAQAASGLSPSI